MMYQFERPFVVDGGKYRRAFGEGVITPHREGIRRTIDWYRSNLRASPWWRDVLRYGRASRSKA